MNQKIVTNLVYVLLGVCLGYIIFSLTLNKTPEVSMDMSTEQSGDIPAMSMPAHSMIEVDQNLPIASISIEALKDEKDGYNLHLTTENYLFTPEKVNGESIHGQGHAHLYVNGVKISRLYGDWFNISSSVLQDGENLIEVTLNANNHSEWAIDGQHISGTTTVTK